MSIEEDIYGVHRTLCVVPRYILDHRSRRDFVVRTYGTTILREKNTGKWHDEALESREVKDDAWMHVNM